MPHIQTYKIDDVSRVEVWKLTESVDDLLHLACLSPIEKESFSNIKHESRKREWLATRALLMSVLKRKVEIEKASSGRPFFKDEQINISISHTVGMVVVLLAENENLGVDVENLSRSIGRVAPRFLSEQELVACEQSEKQRRLMCHWCAKEAVFKAIDESDIDFANQIRLDSMNLQESEGSANWRFISKNGKEQKGTVRFIFAYGRCIASVVA